MPGDKSKRAAALQAELNRHALIETGKRLTDLEKKIWDLERDAKSLKYFSQNSLNTTKRLQGAIAKILAHRQAKKAQ